jgi:hypothetical protein
VLDHSLVGVDLGLGGLEVRVGAQHILWRVVQASLAAALATSLLTIALNRGLTVVDGEAVSRVHLIRGVRVHLSPGKLIEHLLGVCLVVHEWVR